jgi:hypothetical protein
MTMTTPSLARHSNLGLWHLGNAPSPAEIFTAA